MMSSNLLVTQPFVVCVRSREISKTPMFTDSGAEITDCMQDCRDVLKRNHNLANHRSKIMSNYGS
jgi:hypothetical protein